MSYLVYCTFDLKNALSKDYEKAYEELKEIGLTQMVKGGTSLQKTRNIP